MSTHLDAIEALIPDGIGHYRTDAGAPLPRAPYLVLIAPEFMARTLTLAGERPVGDYFQAMYVGESDAQLRDTIRDVRAVWDRVNVTPTGWRGRIRLRTVQGTPAVDRAVALPGAGHPHHMTDLYRYDAAPTGITGS